ncbi:MAG: hypothetical protein CME06_03280 [Gemmatimonadetes bacterium]|nr:hypothetical protein [Gemmatimonadota bacterium]
MNVDPALVRHVARLAGLTLNDDQVGGLAVELREILTHFETLGTWSAGHEEPEIGTEGGCRVEREDDPDPALPNESGTLGSPASARGHFRVPPTIQGR